MWRAILLLLCLTSLAQAQTGTSKTAAQLANEININFADNTSGAITPFAARQTFLDMVSSTGQFLTTSTWTTQQTFTAGINVGTGAHAIVLSAGSTGSLFQATSGPFDFGDTSGNVWLQIANGQLFLNNAGSSTASQISLFTSLAETLRLQTNAAGNFFLSADPLTIGHIPDNVVWAQFTGSGPNFLVNTSATGTGGLYMCINTNGAVYKKATCP